MGRETSGVLADLQQVLQVASGCWKEHEATSDHLAEMTQRTLGCRTTWAILRISTTLGSLDLWPQEVCGLSLARIHSTLPGLLVLVLGLASPKPGPPRLPYFRQWYCACTRALRLRPVGYLLREFLKHPILAPPTGPVAPLQNTLRIQLPCFVPAAATSGYTAPISQWIWPTGFSPAVLPSAPTVCPSQSATAGFLNLRITDILGCVSSLL